MATIILAFRDAPRRPFDRFVEAVHRRSDGSSIRFQK
jgi:hypothetical protein